MRILIFFTLLLFQQSIFASLYEFHYDFSYQVGKEKDHLKGVVNAPLGREITLYKDKRKITIIGNYHFNKERRRTNRSLIHVTTKIFSLEGEKEKVLGNYELVTPLNKQAKATSKSTAKEEKTLTLFLTVNKKPEQRPQKKMKKG